MREVRKKWKHPDSSNSDSIAYFMTLLTTQIFDCHRVISGLMTPLTDSDFESDFIASEN